MNSRQWLVLILLLSATVCRCTPFREGYEKGLRESNEAHLRASLSTMRDGIKKYTNEKGAPPQSLDELTDAGYITHVPRDMITNKNDWVIVKYQCSGSANCKEGIKDVHSASTTKSSNGTPYSEW